MNGRWSDGSTSGSNAGHRFVCWEASDDFDHTQLEANWDTLHYIIGGPEAWPTGRGPSGGIYQSLANIIADLVPVGAVIAWAPPSTSATNIPAGWVPCDGRVMASGSHDFGSGSYRTPDLRNRFLLGAAAPDGAAPVVGSLAVPYTYPGDAQKPAEDNTGATAGGVNAVGGANLSTHNHFIPHHYHVHPHIHELHSTTDDSSSEQTAALNTNVGTTNSLSKYHHVHDLDAMSTVAKVVGGGVNNNVTLNQTSIPVFNQTGVTPVSVSGGDSPTAPGGGTNVGAGQASATSTGLMFTNAPSATQQDLRPQWYSLLYLVKVKRQATAP